ncbi:hypothetical protein BDZ89DRAFT_1043633 [Hymenopellis radicata]|nr:hypothetical protein BDZ89DRAFT_1043633 [Hymenopellis radicata]
MFFWGGTAPKSDAVESISELRSNQCTLSLHFDAHAGSVPRRACWLCTSTRTLALYLDAHAGSVPRRARWLCTSTRTLALYLDAHAGSVHRRARWLCTSTRTLSLYIDAHAVSIHRQPLEQRLTCLCCTSKCSTMSFPQELFDEHIIPFACQGDAHLDSDAHRLCIQRLPGRKAIAQTLMLVSKAWVYSARRILWEKVVIRANDYNAAGDVAVPFMASQEILDCIRVVEFLHPITPHTIDYVLHRFIKVREVTFTHEISRREGCVRWFSLRTIQLRHVRVDYQLLHRVNTLAPHMVVLALLGGVVLGNAGGRPPLKIPSLHLVLDNTVKNTTTSDRKILFDVQGLQAFNAYGYACSSETTGFMDVANVTSLKELWLSFHLFRSGSSAGQLLMGAADNATTLTVTHLEVFVMGPSRNILQTARITNLISLALAELVSARVCVDLRWRCLYHEEEDSQRLRARQEMCAYMGALARETAPAYIQETVEDLRKRSVHGIFRSLDLRSQYRYSAPPTSFSTEYHHVQVVPLFPAGVEHQFALSLLIAIWSAKPQLGLRFYDSGVEQLLRSIQVSQQILRRASLRLRRYSFANVTCLDTDMEALPKDTSGFQNLRLQDVTLRYHEWSADVLVSTLRSWQQENTLEKLRILAIFREYSKSDCPCLVGIVDAWFQSADFCDFLNGCARLEVFALSDPSPIIPLNHGWTDTGRHVYIPDHDGGPGDSLELIARLDPAHYEHERRIIAQWNHRNLAQVFLFHSFCYDYYLNCVPSSVMDVSVEPCGILSEWVRQPNAQWRRKELGQETIDKRLSAIPFGHDFWYYPMDEEPYVQALRYEWGYASGGACTSNYRRSARVQL